MLESDSDKKLDIILNFPYSHDESFQGISYKKIYGVFTPSMGYEFKDDVVAGRIGDDVENFMGAIPISKKMRNTFVR